MSLAVERSKRSNAGNKMARLLNEEEEDEFYTNTYGGFTEENDDVSYKSESSESDQIDSDFDVDETQQQGEETDKEEDGEPRKKKVRRLVTKAYKEPARDAVAKEAKEVRPRKPKVDPSHEEIDSKPEKKTLRQSTQAKTAETVRQREEEYKEKMLKDIAARKNVPLVRRLTQEELLEEAQITEEINTRSLAQFQRLEMEKKKARAAQKSKVRVPMVRYHSVTVPLLDENGADFDDDPLSTEIRQLGIVGHADTKCSRTFVTFEDDAGFTAAFPSGGKPRCKEKYCVITGEKARYFDPLTKTPYANLAAFRVLRKLYSIHRQTGAKAVDIVRKYRRGEIVIGSAD